MTLETVVKLIADSGGILTVVISVLFTAAGIVGVVECAVLAKKRAGNDRKCEKLKADFLTSKTPGKQFVLLVKKGVFPSLKTGNHGGDFPEKKQTENFKKYATAEIAGKVSSLEVSHEEFII